MTRAEQSAVRRNQRGLRRRSVGPAVLSRPHGLSTGAGVAVRVLEVAAPASIGAVSLSLRAPDGGRLRGQAPAGLVVEITSPDAISAASSIAWDKSPSKRRHRYERRHRYG